MSRFYKKCFLASGGMHVLLALILVVCPAFLASNPKVSDVQPITFIPDIVNDSAFAGGGRPDADRPAARAPTPPAPAALPAPAPPRPQVKPKVKEVAPPEIDTESLEVAKDNKPTKRRPEVSLTPVVRKPKTKPSSEDTSAEDRQARERETMRNRLAAAFDHTIGVIKSGTGTLGRKHTVSYGLYVAHGFINPVFAAKTGFDDDDLKLLWKALANLFELDRSAARGTMSTRGLYIFKHESKLGNAQAQQLFEKIEVKKKEGVESPRSFADYVVTLPTAGSLPQGVTLIDGLA